VVLEITWPPSNAYNLERPDALMEAHRWIKKARQPA
jgi:hypothetical protein